MPPNLRLRAKGMRSTRNRVEGVLLLWLALMCALPGTSSALAGPAPPTVAETPADLNKKGSDLIGQNRYDEAHTAYDRALALANNSAERALLDEKRNSLPLHPDADAPG